MTLKRSRRKLGESPWIKALPAHFAPALEIEKLKKTPNQSKSAAKKRQSNTKVIRKNGKYERDKSKICQNVSRKFPILSRGYAQMRKKRGQDPPGGLAPDLLWLSNNGNWAPSAHDGRLEQPLGSSRPQSHRSDTPIIRMHAISVQGNTI